MTDRKEEPVVPGVGARINRCTFPQPSGMARHYPRPTGMARCFPSSAEWPNVSPAQRHGQTFPRPTGMAKRFPSSVAWPDISPAHWHGQTFSQPSGMARRFPHFPSSCRPSGATRQADSPCLTFRHLPPNSATTGYATKRLYSLSPSSCPPTLSAPTERFGY